MQKKTKKKNFKEARTTRWILKLNPKGQATIPLEVRRIFGVSDECRELELIFEDGGFRIRPYKPPLPVQKYIGFCAEELKEVDDAVAYLQELRGRDPAGNEVKPV